MRNLPWLVLAIHEHLEAHMATQRAFGLVFFFKRAALCFFFLFLMLVVQNGVRFAKLSFLSHLELIVSFFPHFLLFSFFFFFFFLFVSWNSWWLYLGTDECVEAFNELKLKHTYKFIVFAMDAAHSKIEILKKGPKNATYDQFLEELPENECRYAIFDYE
jgi:hypothetical protein